eukprot:3490306-Pleurochrysis_carterae.AAC.2
MLPVPCHINTLRVVPCTRSSHVAFAASARACVPFLSRVLQAGAGVPPDALRVVVSADDARARAPLLGVVSALGARQAAAVPRGGARAAPAAGGRHADRRRRGQARPPRIGADGRRTGESAHVNAHAYPPPRARAHAPLVPLCARSHAQREPGDWSAGESEGLLSEVSTTS